MNGLPEQLKNAFILRRCALKTLYERFKEHPYAAVELKEIEEDCRTDTALLNWNLVYLEKCGYVELAKSSESGPYIALTATITAEGIDLVEDHVTFDRRFLVKEDKIG